MERVPYVVLFVIEHDLGQHVPGFRIDRERDIVGGEIRYFSVYPLVRVLRVHAADQFPGLALLHREFVRQADEFRILVVYVRHFDVHRRRAEQAARILRFYQLQRRGETGFESKFNNS